MCGLPENIFGCFMTSHGPKSRQLYLWIRTRNFELWML